MYGQDPAAAVTRGENRSPRTKLIRKDLDLRFAGSVKTWNHYLVSCNWAFVSILHGITGSDVKMFGWISCLVCMETCSRWFSTFTAFKEEYFGSSCHWNQRKVYFTVHKSLWHDSWGKNYHIFGSHFKNPHIFAAVQEGPCVKTSTPSTNRCVTVYVCVCTPFSTNQA